MKKIVKIATLALMMPVMSALVSCDDVFEPAIENHKNEQSIADLPLWVNGLLSHAYISNPLDGWTFNDVATDDAVSNQTGNSYLQMALGSWTANNNPTDQWRDLRGSIQFLNMVIEMAPGAPFSDIETTQAMFVERLQGEAYGLRALFMYHLLRHHAGWTTDGELLGVPIVLESETVNSNFNVPRNTFKECYQQLMKDADMAISMLPNQFVNVDEVPAKYQGKGINLGEYNRVWGIHMANRMNARVAKAVKAQAALLAASPAFSEGSGVTFAEAAELYADVLADLGANPISQIDPTGHIWYADNNVLAGIGAGANPLEIMWRGNKGENSDIETSNYPPTLNGNGNINPSQNLVDAFPMVNGYPITDALSEYDPKNPYANRDPRLAKYIVFDGASVSVAGTVVETDVDDAGNISGLNNWAAHSTRTGYYMRKHLNEQVTISTTGSANSAFHYNAFIRYTEMFLSYAEAANEVWGPTGDGGNGYSAYDVIKAIRLRAGITGTNGVDGYLESVKNDKDKMRELIRNERRLELCFEGHRFWDLRRWKANLNETVKGVSISGNNYNYIDVEKREFKSHQYYGPIPYSEVVKYSNLQQNEGW